MRPNNEGISIMVSLAQVLSDFEKSLAEVERLKAENKKIKEENAVLRSALKVVL